VNSEFLTIFLLKFGSIKIKNVFGSASVYQELSKNDFFEILGNYFVARQIFGLFFLTKLQI
jgi:hypothetical protein